VKSLNSDPGERIPIHRYSSRIRDEVRRHYIQRGPCQPVYHKFSKTLFGKKMRQFSPGWFKDSHSRWLEYSVKKDAAFYLCCYLFKNDYVHSSTCDSFTKTDFKAWNNYLVCYFEKEVFVNISNDAIIDRFQNMKARRVQL